MTGYVVDASVVVKWLVKEEWSDEASTLLEVEATLIAPELLSRKSAMRCGPCAAVATLAARILPMPRKR